MAHAFGGTLHLVVRVSSGQKAMVIGLHALTAAVALWLAVHRPWLWALLPVIGASAFVAWRLALLRVRHCIVRLRWPADDAWFWQTRDGRWHEGTLSDAFVVGSWLVILTLADEQHRWRRTRCLLFHDALSAQSHRHLRARLTVRPPVRAAVDV